MSSANPIRSQRDRRHSVVAKAQIALRIGGVHEIGGEHIEIFHAIDIFGPDANEVVGKLIV